MIGGIPPAPWFGCPQMPLTDTAIRSAKPAEKPVRMFDGNGMYLEISPSGGKLWRLKYRFDGKEKRLALGVYPDVGLKQARARRDEARRLLAEGIDPGAHRKATKAAVASSAANSFEAVAREWFAKMQPTWAAGHADKIIRRLVRDVFPWIGGTPIADLSAPDVLATIHRIEARGRLETAHRALQTCGQVCRAMPWPPGGRYATLRAICGARCPHPGPSIWPPSRNRLKWLRCCGLSMPSGAP